MVRIAISWRKGVRKLLGLPYNTHCDLINLICNDIPISNQLDKRVLKCLSSCAANENILVGLCYCLACYGSQSAMCSNISFLCSKYGICRYDVTSGIDRMVTNV